MKPHRVAVRAAVLGALLVCNDTTWADDIPYRLDEVVVTGTRTEKRLLDVPVRTEIVTQEEIQRTEARDLKEALENVPGLILRETHGKQGQEVWMQGFDSDRVLILRDGERLTATTGSTEVYKLQILAYYHPETTESGWYSIRYARVTP
jgi:outer membrane cobalamin receptor